MHLLPQLRRLNYLQYSPTSATTSSTVVSSDPHMHEASASQILRFAVPLHLFFLLFLFSFLQASITSPGSVPRSDHDQGGGGGKSEIWERGDWRRWMTREEDEEVERIVRDRDTDLTKVGIE